MTTPPEYIGDDAISRIKGYLKAKTSVTGLDDEVVHAILTHDAFNGSSVYKLRVSDLQSLLAMAEHLDRVRADRDDLTTALVRIRVISGEAMDYGESTCKGTSMCAGRPGRRTTGT